MNSTCISRLELQVIFSSLFYHVQAKDLFRGFVVDSNIYTLDSSRLHSGTNYAANSTAARLQRAGNNLPSTVDLFHDGVRILKWKVKGAVLPT
ncbi:hypothetical protein J6590_070695 [Homalodisca vitripennis]|nr:hypothetical protein J6590_070695 [Homalodisca vitripennis]